MAYKTACKGDGIPEHIQRPLPQDLLFEIPVRFNNATEYERTEVYYAYGFDLRSAERNFIREKLTDNGWQFEPDTYSNESSDGYFYNPYTQDCCRLDGCTREFSGLDTVNGDVSAARLAEYIHQRQQDKAAGLVTRPGYNKREGLTLKQVKQIDAFESEVYLMLDRVLSIPHLICADPNCTTDENDQDFDDIRTIMDYVVAIGERHGIPEMDIYPYVEGNKEYHCLGSGDKLTHLDWLNHRSGDCKECREPEVYG